MDYVSGEPERLEAFAPEAARLVDSLRGDVADYQQALADFASQPSDLPTPDLSDRGARVEELTGELERLGHELTVFAEALRDADAAAMAHGSQPVPGGLGAVTVTGGAAGRLMESVEERLRDTDRPADLFGPWGAALVRTGGRVGLARNLARSGAHATRLVETQARLARLRTDLAGTPHRLGYESAQGFRHRVAQNRALARDELARARVGRADTFRDLRHNNPIPRAPSRLANTRVAGLLRGGSKALGPIGVVVSGADFADALIQ